MTALKPFLRNALPLFCVVVLGFCSAKYTASEIVLLGSTPGDELIKSMLAIPASTKIDFIRWNLKLDNNDSFVLDIVFGESQPNTLGFKGDGEKRTFNGTFSVSENGESSTFREVYHLKSSSFPDKISLVKLNENLFHLLTPQNQLMNGNGGWSYSLNKRDPATMGEILISSTTSDNKWLQLVFDGRTPCRQIANEHPEMNASQSCFKLKWRLILNRDSSTYLPTSYTIRKVVDNEPRDISGKWTIIRGTSTNPDVIIYRIDPENPDESISFLVGDDNVLFFLNKRNELHVGNKDFSFTLNRKVQ